MCFDYGVASREKKKKNGGKRKKKASVRKRTKEQKTGEMGSIRRGFNFVSSSD